MGLRRAAISERRLLHLRSSDASARPGRGRNNDHFFRDHLTDTADILYQDGQLLSLKEFTLRLSQDDTEYRTAFTFLDGACRQEPDRFRFDRLIAVQLVLMATLNRFGYAYSSSTPARPVHRDRP